ncbi:hypothetical protein DL767_001709 [Monosporascus sp. MG133]|nr:hypothetical protein DL767_001709 [Monosporascus sp. MG133]
MPEPLSAYAVRLHFSYTSVRFGQGISVARHPLVDRHSFARFTDQFDSPDTKSSYLRGVPTNGFGYVFRMFERIISATTGSGIGPCLSFIKDARRPDMRVVWQTKSPLKRYAQKTLDLVRRMDERPVMIDTSVSGRVDMLPIVLRLYKEFGAEAACIISNPQMTRRLVYGLETRRIAAYEPIFDG